MKTAADSSLLFQKFTVAAAEERLITPMPEKCHQVKKSKS
jgi:hypothetical protein